MSVMEKLRNLFQRADIPDEAREIFASAKNSKELLKGLETKRGENEIELRDNEEQLMTIERALLAEEARIRKGGLTPTEETILLRRIERLEKQRATIERQVSIFNENVNLHLNLIAKIQEMEAMRSRGVSEDSIDRLVEEVEDSIEEYKRVVMATQGGAELPAAVDMSAEKRKLAEIKKRIVGSDEQGKSSAARLRREKSEVE